MDISHFEAIMAYFKQSFFDQFYSKDTWKIFIAEFFSSLAAVFILVFALYSLVSASWRTDKSEMIGIGLMIYAIINVCGHCLFFNNIILINPSLTLALLFSRRIGLLRGILFIVAQIVGGLIGGYLSLTVIPRGLVDDHPVCWNNDDNYHLSESRMLYFEFLLSSIVYILLMGLIFNERRSAVIQKWGNIYGLACFICLLTGVRWIGIAGNPLFSFAIALSQNCENLSLVWRHWVGTILAAIFATLFHMMVEKLLNRIKKRKFFNYRQERDQNGGEFIDDDDDDLDMSRSETTSISRASF